jgi:hypothetical protein
MPLRVIIGLLGCLAGFTSDVLKVNIAQEFLQILKHI